MYSLDRPTNIYPGICPLDFKYLFYNSMSFTHIFKTSATYQVNLIKMIAIWVFFIPLKNLSQLRVNLSKADNL